MVKWKGLPDSEATWEMVHLIKLQFPSFYLEDKMQFEPSGNVRLPICPHIKQGVKREMHNTKERIAPKDSL